MRIPNITASNQNNHSGAGETERSVLDMSHTDARRFFLKPDSYCELRLPKYFDFGLLLNNVNTILNSHTLASSKLTCASDKDINYTIYSNLDGRYSWRPFKLVHPVLYVDLVHKITEPGAWKHIRNRFKLFSRNSQIKCLSVPIESLTEKPNQQTQISHWWRAVEQRSIELALDYNFVFQTDIANCYGSFYTHSVAWALHGKEDAKNSQRDKSLIGNVIDNRLQDMNQRQTNGIPQGSVLFDFIAEMILGYADQELHSNLQKSGIRDFKILRFRDDYRIFVKRQEDGEQILKALTEMLISLGLKLNIAKTTGAQPVIASSIKQDKLQWFQRKQDDTNLQTHLLIIHQYSIEFPNSGSLVRALEKFYNHLETSTPEKDIKQLISITVDIAFHNPRCFPICTTIISALLEGLNNKSHQLNELQRVKNKLSQLPNHGYLEIWQQRMSLPIDQKVTYAEKLCLLVIGEPVNLWSSSWLSCEALRQVVDAKLIVNQETLDATPLRVDPQEASIFHFYE